MIPQCEPLIGEKERKAVNRYLKSGGYLTEYKETEKFEKMLADFLGVKYVSCVPSGTVALFLSLWASETHGVVLVPDFTMIATTNAVLMANGLVNLVDIERDSFCFDISKANLEGVQVIIYVDINGRAGDIEAVRKYCKKKGIVLIEDACQAFGSKHNGKYLGTFGRFGCFSLSYHKIITTGNGGFVVTHTKKDYETIERLKDFGRLKGGKDYHPYLGFNFKFTDLQAVIGMEQLKTIEWRMKKKRQIWKWYFGAQLRKGHIPWFIETFKKPKKGNFETRPFYPPIHSQPNYFGEDEDFPVATEISKKGLWLPSSLTLTKKDVDYIKRYLCVFSKIPEANLGLI